MNRYWSIDHQYTVNNKELGTDFWARLFHSSDKVWAKIAKVTGDRLYPKFNLKLDGDGKDAMESMEVDKENDKKGDLKPHKGSGIEDSKENDDENDKEGDGVHM